MKSQGPWQMGLEHCTLTILENAVEGLVQFEMLKQSDRTTMTLTATNEQFDGLLKEQTGLSGTLQVNAAIAQMFSEAHAEIEDPAGRRASLESFGEDDFGDDSQAKQKPLASGESRWQVQSQQPWLLGDEHCTLTILENKHDGQLQFELLKQSTQITVYVSCTNAQFDGLCDEQVGLVGTAKTNAALAQLFREAHDEMGAN